MLPTTVVLVRPKFSVNVGYVSRAMANMGVERLILVAPRCRLDQRALEGAAGGNEPLSKAVIFPDWKSFYEKEGAGLRIGFTRRMGELRTVEPITEAIPRLFSSHEIKEIHSHLYLVFGPEDHGLDLEDLSLMHVACSLPTYGEFGSMNLAHAVLLALYVVRSSLGDKAKGNENADRPERLDFPHEILEEWLVMLGFDLTQMRKNAALKITQMMLRAVPTPKEIKLFQDILFQTVRKLKRAHENNSNI